MELTNDEIKYILDYDPSLINEDENELLEKWVKYQKYEVVREDYWKVNRYFMERLGINAHMVAEGRLIDIALLRKAIAERIHSEHEIVFNKCPVCGTLARTPKAKQAKCGHRWA